MIALGMRYLEKILFLRNFTMTLTLVVLISRASNSLTLIVCNKENTHTER